MVPVTLHARQSMFYLQQANRHQAFKLCKVMSVLFGQKGIPYLNTYDDRTIRYPNPLIKANDTIKIDLETNKIMDFIKFLLMPKHRLFPIEKMDDLMWCDRVCHTKDVWALHPDQQVEIQDNTIEVLENQLHNVQVELGETNAHLEMHHQEM
eukprot:XP_008680402.1 uncharacterized protein LOC103655424 [Zea mays]